MIPKQLFLCIWSILCVLGMSSVIEAKESRDIAKQAFPSVVMLVMEDDNGQPLSLGSGFFVRDDIIATNLHVVEGAAGGYAKIVSKKQKYDIAGYVAIDRKMDLVLLKINKVKAPAIALGDSSTIAVGDEIFAVGNPKGLEGTFSKGIISAIRKIEEDNLLQITAPLSPGSSGGPILNIDGEVIGISVATFKGGQNLNFAIPVSYLSNLLTKTKSVKPLSVKEKTEKKTKSILADLGGKSTEGVIGTHFRCWQPTYYFSLHNKLRCPVTKIVCLVVFYGKNGEPIDIDVVKCNEVIPGGLARRVKSDMHEGVFSLVEEAGWNPEGGIPQGKIEIRVLNFQIVEDSEYEL